MNDENVILQKEKFFKKGKSGNPNGRPPRGAQPLLAKLAALGYGKISVKEALEVFSYLVNMPIEQVKKRASYIKKIDDVEEFTALEVKLCQEILGKGFFPLYKDWQDRLGGRPAVVIVNKEEDSRKSIGVMEWVSTDVISIEDVDIENVASETQTDD